MTKSALIIGNGGSANNISADLLNRYDLIIGTNRALVMKSLAGVRLDALVIRDGYRGFFADDDIACKYHELIKGDTYVCGSDESRWSTHCNEFVRMSGKSFVSDSTKNKDGDYLVMQNDSVVIQACNWLYHLDVKDFALIGVDYNGQECSDLIDGFNVRTSRQRGNRYSKPVPGCIERQFTELRRGLESNGCSIVNLNPESSLKAIETR